MVQIFRLLNIRSCVSLNFAGFVGIFMIVIKFVWYEQWMFHKILSLRDGEDFRKFFHWKFAKLYTHFYLNRINFLRLLTLHANYHLLTEVVRISLKSYNKRYNYSVLPCKSLLLVYTLDKILDNKDFPAIINFSTSK